MDPLGTLSPDELVEQLRRAGQLWEKLLFISGGTLNVSVSSYMQQTNGFGYPGLWNSVFARTANCLRVRLTWCKFQGSLTFSFLLMSHVSANKVWAVP